MQAADYDDDTQMEYTPPEETSRRQRQREIEQDAAERERQQKVHSAQPSYILLHKIMRLPELTLPQKLHYAERRTIQEHPLLGSRARFDCLLGHPG